MKRTVMVAGVSLAMIMGMTGAVPALAASADAPAAPKPPAPSLSRAISAADQIANSGADALAKGPYERYDRQQVTPWVKGLYSVAYERTYRGLPVVGGDAVVLADTQGRVRAAHSATSADIDVSTTPKVTASAAVNTAKKRLTTVDRTESRRLVVHVQKNKARLAWETVVAGTTAKAPSRMHVYVDANTGKVLDSYDEVHAGTGTSKWNGPSPLSIDTTASGSSYSLRDPNRPGLSCADYSTGQVFSKSSDSWGNGNATSKETGCVDVMWAAQKEWNMLRDWLGRNGHDGNGRSWPVKVGLNDLNAYWDGSSVTIGHNQANEWIAAMDVVGHEIGHGIDQNTPGGANNESGLGEGTGDIMGALTEAYANEPAPYDTPGDYLVGEMINLVGSGPIRNMYDPSKVSNHPKCYSSAIPGTEEHAAAGPLNHWFYLLAEGSNPGNGKPTSPTCNNSTVTGVGIQTAGKIFYGGMLLKTSGMTYKRYRTTTLTAAKNLDPSCDLFTKTKAAWDAISVPAQTGDPTCNGPVQDFSLSVTPSSGSVDPGAATTATVNTTTTTGTAQTVNLTATGAPAGVTVTFDPSSVTSGNSSTMRVAASASATPGTATITVKGQGTTSHTAQYTLTVGGGNPGGQAPDIDVSRVQAHLTELNAIANRNGGNRHSTGQGYRDSLAYVKGKLQAAGYTVTEQTCASGCSSGAGNNLIAEWPKGDANSVYMFGAHLDGVSAGPGINDNGSGSAALLENALVLAQQNPTMTSRVRFAWWTDEEAGLNGSSYYASTLTSAQRSAIKAYYNFDMVGSPNAGYFINHITSTAAKPMKAYWDSKNLQPEENTEGAGRSDDYSFEQVGIPTSGYASGASYRKTSAQAAKWGGTANAAYDGCYHSSCDTTSNINATALNHSADGIAHTLWTQAVGGENPPENDFSLSTNPTSGTTDPGASLTTTVSTATTSGTAQTVNLSASGAPSGVTVTFSPTSVTSGQSSTATVAVGSGVNPGTYNITITGTGSVSHSTSYSLVVRGTGGCTGSELVVNGGFESGTAPWTGQTGAIGSIAGQSPHTGTRYAWLSGYGYAENDTINQSVTVPSGCSATLSYWMHIDTDETEAVEYDTLEVQVNGTTVQTLSNVDAAPGYVKRTVNLSQYAGQQVTLSFSGTEDAYLQTSFVLDDVSVQTS